MNAVITIETKENDWQAIQRTANLNLLRATAKRMPVLHNVQWAHMTWNQLKRFSVRTI